MKRSIGLIVFLVGISFCATYLGQLVTPSYTTALSVRANNSHTFQCVLIGVSNNVLVRAEGTLDGTNYFNLNDDGLNTTLNVDGSYKLYKSSFAVDTVRLGFISEDGATTATLDVYYTGNKN